MKSPSGSDVPTEGLGEAVREVLSDLFRVERFAIEESSAGLLVVSSAQVVCRFTVSRRGEFEVAIAPHGTESWKGWVYAGFVGRADLTRLLEIAGDQVRADPRILDGDPGYFAELAAQRETEQADYNVRATGQVPRPRPERLP